MRSSQKNDVLLDLAHLVGLALDGPVRGEKDDRVQGNYGNRHVGPAAAAHVFMIQRNDHGGASRLKSGLRGSGASRDSDKTPSDGRGTAALRRLAPFWQPLWKVDLYLPVISSIGYSRDTSDTPLTTAEKHKSPAARRV